jgi:hypothetical protein
MRLNNPPFFVSFWCMSVVVGALVWLPGPITMAAGPKIGVGTDMSWLPMTLCSVGILLYAMLASIGCFLIGFAIPPIDATRPGSARAMLAVGASLSFGVWAAGHAHRWLVPDAPLGLFLQIAAGAAVLIPMLVLAFIAWICVRSGLVPSERRIREFECQNRRTRESRPDCS